MAKIDFTTQTEPTNHPDSGKSFLYIDSADNLLTSMDSDGNVKKYITTYDIPLSWLDSALNFLDMTTAEPSSPATGDRYINTVTGTSSQTSQSVTANNVYQWSGSAWAETVVTDGDAIIITNPSPNEAYTFNGAAWVNYGTTTIHNSLSGLQGGTSDQYYHLTSAAYSYLTDANAQLEALQTDGSPTFAGITSTGDVGITGKITVTDYTGDFSQIAVYDASVSTFTKASEFYVDETNGITSNYYAGNGAGGLSGTISFKIKDTGASYADSITTTGDAFVISASALTTGNLLTIDSSQASTDARTLLNIKNLNAGATGTTLLKVNNASTGLALDITGNVELDGGFILNEVASSPVSSVAGKGVLWIRDTSPNVLMFTDDAGTDYTIGGADVADTLAEVLAIGNTTGGNDILLSGTDSYATSGTHTGVAFLVNAAQTTSNIMSLNAPSLTTGGIANFTSSSSDPSTRNLLQIQNTDSGATGTIPLYINQSANNIALNIVASGVTNTYALNVEADNLILEGSIARFYSNSSNTQVRDLVIIQNDNVNATESTCLAVYQKGDADGVYIETDGATAWGLEVAGNSLTTGKLARLRSSSSDTSTRNLIDLINDSPSATGTTCLYIQQDSTGLAINSQGDVNISGGLILEEESTVPVSAVAGKGVLWVRDDVPNALVFTDDTGTDHDLTGAGAVDTLAEVLASGNATGGSDITLSAGDTITNSVGHTGQMINLASESTTTAIASITGNLLTTGSMLRLTSSSTENDARSLLYLSSTSELATGTTLIDLNHETINGISIDINGGNINHFTNTTTGTAYNLTLDDASTGLGLSITGNSLTSGSLAKFYSDSSDISNRSLFQIINDNALATGTTTLYIQNDANNQSLDIDCIGLTSSRGVNIEANAITTGQALRVYSNSSDTSTRVLTYLVNDNAAASGARLLQMQQDADAISWYLDQNGDGNAIYLDGAGNVTTDCISAIANNLTSGSMARFYSNSASTSTRNLFEIINDNSASVNSTNLYLQQDADGGFAINATGTNARSRFLTSFEVSRVTVAGSTYSIVGEDNVILVSYTTAGSVTITIPTAQMYEGRILRIKDSGGSATTNNITIGTGGSETIDGSATLVINDNYQSVTLVSDGVNWFII